jgi:hypothetical protein
VKRRFAATCIALPLAAVPAQSAPLEFPIIPKSTPEQSRRLDLRLIEDPVFASTPLHNSGMIAGTSVTRNTTIGVGLLKVAPRRLGSGEFRQENGASGSRKAAVRFTLKF